MGFWARSLEREKSPPPSRHRPGPFPNPAPPTLSCYSRLVIHPSPQSGGMR
jgi:hypothetical protein